MKLTLTPEEATKLIGTCDDKTPIDLRDRALIIVGLETGMLCMSLAGMRLEEIKECAAGYPIVRVPIKGKNGIARKPYLVPLSDTAVAALAPWLAWLRSKKIVDGPVFRALSRRVARGGKLMYEPGSTKPMSRITIYQAITRRAKRARLRSISPALFRSTFITWRMAEGLPPYKIAAITGHDIANLKGMSSFEGHIDLAAIGAETRRSTPAWLAKLVRRV